MIRKSVLLAVVLVGISTVSAVRAADEQIDRESLRSLDGVRVAVEELPSGAPNDLNTTGLNTAGLNTAGLNKDALRRFVESRLVAAHVPLQMPGEYPTGDPFLRVTIATATESSGVAGYHVQLEFVQIVFVRRNPMLTFNRAPTWAANARMGLAPRGQLTERVQKELAAEVDQFIAAYKSVNTN